jgi:hypothetical protein
LIPAQVGHVFSQGREYVKKPARKPTRPRPPNLTIKQRKFIDGKLQGKSSARAARDAGYSESVCRKADRFVSNSVKVRRSITGIMELAGITDEQLAQRVAGGLNATRVLNKTRHAKREVVVDFRERREMVELILRLKGLLTNRHDARVTGPTLAELLEES